jgi:hypothetical protein
MEDVVYFKNGAVLHGQVLEQWPGVSIKIQTHDGLVRAYRMADVAKIVKFELPPENTSAPGSPPAPPSIPSGPGAEAPGSSRAGKIGFGLIAGMNLANLNTGNLSLTPGNGLSPLVGFVGGCFVDFGLSDVISIEPELYFSMKGSSAGYEDLSVNYNYLELPILFKLNFPAGPDLRIDLFTGPAPALLTSASDSYQGISTPDNFINSGDLGWVIGSGLEIGQFLLDLRYENGLISIYKSGFDLAENNTAFSLLVGCRLF